MPGPLLQHLPSLGPRGLPRGAPAAAGAHGGAAGAGGGAARRGAAAHGLGAAERRDELGGATATGGRFWDLETWPVLAKHGKAKVAMETPA